VHRPPSAEAAAMVATHERGHGAKHCGQEGGRDGWTSMGPNFCSGAAGRTIQRHGRFLDLVVRVCQDGQSTRDHEHQLA
jgi:hypothetical protein